VIGVVDLVGGRAVRARAGERDRYQTVTAVADWPIEGGHPLAVARAYVDRCGVAELYAADLDAIVRGQAQDATIRSLASVGAPLWLDAAVTSIAGAERALGLGASRVVVGLETLPSYDTLRDISAAIGGERVAFSLDLRERQPIVRPTLEHPPRRSASNVGQPSTVCEAACAIVEHVAGIGVPTMIVIDLSRIGTRRGVDYDLLSRVRDAAPAVELLAGGGVQGADDLRRLAAIGCDGALVASALHDGGLTAADLVAAHDYRSPTR